MTLLTASGSSTGMGALGGGALVLAGILVWMVPVIVAASRKVPNRGSIFVIDFFLGWTLIGWVVALAMACRTRPQ